MSHAHTYSYKHLGFTGSSKLVTQPQQVALLRLLREAYEAEGFRVLHHGDAIHADEFAHNEWIKFPNSHIHIHPPTNPLRRAYCGRTNKNSLTIDFQKPYLQRNQDIVDASGLLIAAPSSMTAPNPIRGGTWTTFNLALQRRPYIPIFLVFPNGIVAYWEEGQEATRTDIPYR